GLAQALGDGRPRLAAGVGTLAALAAGLAGLLRRELVGGAAPVGRLTALAAGGAGFLGGEFVGGPLGVRRLAPLASDLALLLGRHRREASFAFPAHAIAPF